MPQHLKRYNVPGYWKLKKKQRKFVTSPRAGPHPKGQCIPLSVLIRDVLGLAETGREAKRIIKAGKIMVDRKVRKDGNYPVGLMDVVEIPETKHVYRVMVTAKGLHLEGITHEEAETKLCRIEGKRQVRGGRIQISLHDGRNLLTDSKDYRNGDSLLIKLPEQKVLKHFKFEKGSHAMIIAGRNMGASGKIKEIFERTRMLEKPRVIIHAKDREIETAREYIFVGEVK